MSPILKAIGINAAQKFIQPSTLEDIPLTTIKGANQWAGDNLTGGTVEPFPYTAQSHANRVLGDNWEIPDNAWGRIWSGFGLRRFVWLWHRPTDITIQLVAGESEPRNVVRPSAYVSSSS
ncbi:MAG: hypothetical protein AAGA46_03260 [Cyanobacteria bacterium P01_F01_bin.13]